jgi:hypothetical protein
MAARRKAPTPTLHETHVVSVPASGQLNAVVVADTHSQPHPNAPALIA